MRSASIFIALASLMTAGTAAACRCVWPTPPVAYRQASAVLLGTVRQAQNVSRYDRSYRIEVERSWKKTLKTIVKVNSVRSSCLAELQPGQKYLIYVVTDPAGTMRTSACQGNQRATDATAALAWLDRRG